MVARSTMALDDGSKTGSRIMVNMRGSVMGINDCDSC